MPQSAKAKLNYKPKGDDGERLKVAFSKAISGLQTAVQITKSIASGVGLGPPGLQAVLGGLLLVLTTIQKTFQNAADIEQLAMRIQALSSTLQNLQSQDKLSPSVVARMEQLSEACNGHIEQLNQLANRHILKRLFQNTEDTKAISDHLQAITWSIQNLTVESLLSVEFTLDVHTRFMKRAVAKIESKIDAVGVRVNSGFQHLHSILAVKDGHPPHASSARFDCGGRVPCLEGTRTDVIDQINRWIKSDAQLGVISAQCSNVAEPDGTPNSPVFWINGTAGTGKTTIAYTIANTCHERGVLGASFFCSRDNAECSNLKLIYPTIAYQLGQFFPPFKDEVTAVIKSNSDIGYSDLWYQLRKLIIEPLHTIGRSFPSCVVVIDALDECKDDSTISVILTSLSMHVTQLSSLKFLITSRPEQHITDGFKSRKLNPATCRLVLHEIELGVVAADIERYLSTNLEIIRNSYNLEDSWPSMADIHALSTKSFGLFIFASTSIKFIGDRNYSDPPGQLARLIRSTMPILDTSSPYFCLDRLYTQVMTHAYPNISSGLAGRLKVILGSIMCLLDPLSPRDLELLLTMNAENDSSPSTVRGTLVHLHSVVIVPENDDQVIRLLHPSFFDFLTSLDCCHDPKLVVNFSIQHTLLARACLCAMKDLKRNMCRIDSPTMFNNEVDNLPALINQYISPHLQYACRHWVSHLTNAMISDILLDLLQQICLDHLLHWVEVCSLLGDLRDVLVSLDTAQQAIANNMGQKMSDTMVLLHDCERFVREFFSTISTSAQQVYHSALMFTPNGTLFHEKYCHELPPIRMHGCEKGWDSCLRTMEGHCSGIWSVAFSPDGTRIVSGSSDKTLRLWDAVSGAHLNTLKGHSDSIMSVTFSSDGTRIVSGSTDNTLLLWDAVSGVHLNTLQGHSGSITSVRFSPDGTRIVTGSSDKTVRLWDAVDGVHLNTLEGHSDLIRSVAFSPNGRRIVSGSGDNVLRLWDVDGVHLNTLKGQLGSITSVTFSPDGTRIVSASRDGTFRLWDAVGGVHLNTLKGHSQGAITSITFSQDSTRVVSGSLDNTLRLWDAVSGAHLNTFKGHSSGIQSVAFSPDGTRIVSGSHDETLRLWDAVSSVQLNKLKGHSGSIPSVIFSPDGTRIVSGSSENMLRLWDAVGGVHLNTLKGHSDSITSVTFSPDGTRIVSGSDDNTLRLWDAIGGVHLNTLKGHSGSITSVRFSPDGTRIASGSSDKRLRLWDAVSGAHLNTLKGHSGSITLVKFSPNGTRIVSASCTGPFRGLDVMLRLWDAVSGAHLNTLQGHHGLFPIIEFSPDGTRIVSGSSDKTLHLWDGFSGVRLNTLRGHSSSVTSVTFSADGTRIVSGSSDNTIQLWNVGSGVRLKTFEGHSSSIKSVAFSPNGTRIVSGSRDNTLRLWDVGSGVHLNTLEGYSGNAIFGPFSLACADTFSRQDRQWAVNADPKETFFYFLEDGWIYLANYYQRLCWVPVIYRDRLFSYGKCVALRTAAGQVVVINFSEVITEPSAGR